MARSSIMNIVRHRGPKTVTLHRVQIAAKKVGTEIEEEKQ
jgi:hypothetical protein